MICRGKGEFCHEGRCREVAPYADPVRTAAVPYSEGLKIKGGAHADTVSDGGLCAFVCPILVQRYTGKFNVLHEDSYIVLHRLLKTFPVYQS